jgi:ankyrin repeat protein
VYAFVDVRLCVQSSLQGVKYLLAKGANIRDKAVRGMTALTFAIRGNNQQVAKWLIEEQGRATHLSFRHD